MKWSKLRRSRADDPGQDSQRSERGSPGRATRDVFGAVLAICLVSSTAAAQDAQGPNAPTENVDIASILRQLQEQAKELAAQKRLLVQQQKKIEALEYRLAQGAPPSPAPAGGPAVSSAAPAAPASAQQATAPQQEGPQRVGEEPEKVVRPPEVAVLADVGGVLTHRGTLVVEPYVQFARSSASNFTFEGVQIIDAFLIGLISAGQSSRDLLITGATARYGLSDRLELEARVPFVYRDDRLVGTILNQNNVTTIQQANGYGLGDVELAAHYQINDGQDDWPFFIGNLRFKTDTGIGPYDVSYNANGSAGSLPTGSGFPAIEPSVTIIYPTDPAVLFGNIGYIHSFGGNVGKTLAGSLVGNVDPGDTYSASFGVGLSLNERLSFTLGYEHDYIRPTSQVTNGIPERTEALQAGQFLFGTAFRLSDRTGINVDLAIGATRDAPDVQLTVRVPMSFGVCQGESIFC